MVARLVGLAVVVLVIPVSFAHEQKAALTDIFYNERTGNLEIAHRFSIHDAEHALRAATGVKGGLTKSEETRVAFAKYVAKCFALIFSDKSAMKLTLVGQELERGFLWVYQECSIPEPMDVGFVIDNTILQDVVNGQVNTVNVRYRNQVTTLVFEADTGRRQFAGPSGSHGKSVHLERGR